ncbi:MAG: hypothetical protein WA687_07775 [Solirubrobacterales bacterium]
MVVLGLLAELVAVTWILLSVGIGRWIGDNALLAIHRSKGLARKIWPWTKSPEAKTVEMSAALSGGGAISVRAEKRWPTDRPAPQDLKEVGMRLNEIAAELNEHEQKIGERARSVENAVLREVEKVESELTRRHEKTDREIDGEIRQRFAERKREGGLFAVGVGLQLAGAVLLLGC